MPTHPNTFTTSSQVSGFLLIVHRQQHSVTMLPCSSKKGAFLDSRTSKRGDGGSNSTPDDDGAASVVGNVKKRIESNENANKQLLIHFLGKRDSSVKRPTKRVQERPPPKDRKHATTRVRKAAPARRPTVKPQEMKATNKKDSSIVTREDECSYCKASIAPSIPTTVFIGAYKQGEGKIESKETHHKTPRSQSSREVQVESNESSKHSKETTGTYATEETAATDHKDTIPKSCLIEKMACMGCVLGTPSHEEKSRANSARIYRDVSRRESNQEDRNEQDEGRALADGSLQREAHADSSKDTASKSDAERKSSKMSQSSHDVHQTEERSMTSSKSRHTAKPKTRRVMWGVPVESPSRVESSLFAFMDTYLDTTDCERKDGVLGLKGESFEASTHAGSSAIGTIPEY